MNMFFFFSVKALRVLFTYFSVSLRSLALASGGSCYWMSVCDLVRSFRAEMEQRKAKGEGKQHGTL